MNYDYNTKNQSFLDVHNFLKERGIKNNNFMLQLNNPALANIDPFKPNITQEEIAMVLQECTNNFWYFIREVVRWDHDGEIVHTKLDRGNAAMYWNTQNNISTWRTNIRQTCSDLSVQSILLWQMLKTQFTDKIISNDSPNARFRLRLIMHLSSLLPPYMAFIVAQPKNSNVDNINHIKNSILMSKLDISPTQRTERDAECIFRGDDTNIVFFHRAEIIPHLETLVKNRAPVLGARHKHCINIFNSGYGPNDSESTIFSQNYIEGMIKWQDHFYDYNIDEFTSTINKYSNGVVYIKNNYNELGYDDVWFNEMKTFMDDKNIKREILLQRV